MSGLSSRPHNTLATQQTPDTMASSGETAFADTVAKCDEVMSFFRFAHDTESSFRGTVCFELSTECGRTITRTVRVQDSHYVQLYNGTPQDGNIDCKCSMPFSIFTKVYWGEVHPIPLLMDGTIRIHGWTHGPVLKRFSTAFDFSPEAWDKFYAHQAAEKTVVSSMSTSIPSTHSSSSSSTSPAINSSSPTTVASHWFPTRSYTGLPGRIPDNFELPGAEPSEPLLESASDLPFTARYGLVMRRIIAPSMRAAHPHAFLRSWHRLLRPTNLQKTLRLV